MLNAGVQGRAAFGTSAGVVLFGDVFILLLPSFDKTESMAERVATKRHRLIPRILEERRRRLGLALARGGTT